MSPEKYRKYRCPECRKSTGVGIIYGMPGEDLGELERQGLIVLGGCCERIDDPERACLSCGHEWKIKRRSMLPNE